MPFLSPGPVDFNDLSKVWQPQVEAGPRRFYVPWARHCYVGHTVPKDKKPTDILSCRQQIRTGQLRPMKVEEIAEAVAKLPPDQLARFRRWFTAFEAGRTDHAKELDSTATKLGRLAGRAFAELKKRAKEPRE
jgi:hypothetical protein